MGSQLKVVSMQVRDVLGAREFAMSPGKVSVVKGRNGSGKSSALGALRAVLGGGSLGKLARVGENGEEIEPEVVLVLEGDGEHFRVERNGKGVRVRQRVGDSAALEDVPSPQAFLNGLMDGTLANPVRFLTAPDKERARLLLEALPLSFDRAACLDEMGISEDELREFGPVPAGVLHPLEETAQIRDSVFRARTGVNRDHRQAAASAEQIRRKIPATPPEDPGLAIEQLDQECRQLAEAGIEARGKADAEEDAAVAKARHEFDLAEAAVKGDFKAQAAKLRRAHETKAAELRAEVERKIAADLKETNATIGGLKEAGETQIDEAEAARDAAIKAAQQARAETGAELEKLAAQLHERREKLAALRAQRDSAAGIRALAEQAEEFDTRADGLKKESDRLTRAIEALDRFQRKLADDLPIPGLSIDGTEIRVGGVPFDQLNSAQRTEIAVKVATLRAEAQRLPLIFLDDAEKFDPEAFEELVAALKAAPGQYVLAKVDRGELDVESHNPPAEVVDLAGARS